MSPKIDNKPHVLSLEIQELEVWCNPGCGSSSTSPRCTCPISVSTTGSLFTSKTSQ